MRKKIALFLATLMCISLCACGGSETSSSSLFKKEQEIEITMDNWQEYFEEKEVISASSNAFDELEHIAIHQVIALKDKYEIDKEKSEVDIEYKWHIEEYCVDFDTDTLEYTYGDKIKVHKTPENSRIDSFREHTYKIGDNSSQVIYGLDYSGKGDFYTRVDKETQQRTTEKFFIDEIIRIQGAIYVKEKVLK